MVGKSTATQRLKQDYLRIKKDPVPFVTAEPLPTNILEWHYVIRGPENTPYFGGYYHGKLVFPSDYPYKPPRIYMITPNGRFKTNSRLCLSISDFHPDTWNPAWSVSTILTGLLSFMLENSRTLGSLETSDSEKKTMAQQSLEFNLKDRTFVELFPDCAEEIRQQLQVDESVASTSGAPSASASTSSLVHEAEARGSSFLSSPMAVLANFAVIFGFAVALVAIKYAARDYL